MFGRESEAVLQSAHLPASTAVQATRRRAQRIRALLLAHREAIANLSGRPIELVSGDRRWTRYRKLALLKALAADELTLEDALARFTLSGDELEGWIVQLAATGVDGLRADLTRAKPET